MNIPKTIIIMGRSGSGKGTQIALLKEFLENNNESVYHFESGNLFREMIRAEGYTSDQLRNLIEKGILIPDFFTDWLLVNNLNKNLVNQDQVLILDGYPRTIAQVNTLGQALSFYGREKDIAVVHVEVSEEEVRRRMIERGRGDDIDMEAVENRIKFYNEKVIPSLELLRTKENYTVIDINGEGDIDDIQELIKSALVK